MGDVGIHRNNARVNLKEIRHDGVERINVAQNRVQCVLL
jgi:hypothetical protein